MKPLRSILLLPLAGLLAGCYPLHTMVGHLDLIGRRPRHAGNPEKPAATRRRDARLRQPGTGTARQRVLPTLRQSRRRLPGVERVDHPGIRPRAAPVLLSGRRLRALPRLLQPGIGRTLRGGIPHRRRRCDGRRRHRLFHARLLRRPAHPGDAAPARTKARRPDFPRARTPGDLREGRRHLQRILRPRGGNRGHAALARSAGRRGGAGPLPGDAGACRCLLRHGPRGPRRARRALRFRARRRRHAARQGRRLPRPARSAPGTPAPGSAVGGVGPVVRRRDQQRQACRSSDLLRTG